MDQRDGERGAITFLDRPFPALRKFIAFGQDVCDVNRSSVKDSTPNEKPADQGKRTGDGNRPMVDDEAEPLTVHLTDRGVIGITKAGCALRDLCEHPPRVCRRA